MIPTLVPDCGGLIDTVAMTVPLRLLQTQPSQKSIALSHLVDAWPAGVTLFLMTDDPSDTAFLAWYRNLTPVCAIRLLATGTEAPIQDTEMWVQDSWMAAEQDGTLFLHHLQHTDRPGRQALWLADFCQMAYDQPALHLAGGNTLTGPDFRLLGAQSLDLTQGVEPGLISAAEALRRHAALDSRPLHVFGFALSSRKDGVVELRQQPHHIDLVVSLTGQQTRDGRPIILVADPRKTLNPDGPRMEGWSEQLDASVARLETDGFHVIRNKVPYLAHPTFSPNPNLRAYNNIVLENEIRADLGRTRPLVWLPHFADLEPDLDIYDRVNRDLWEGLGFEVVPVYGWSTLVRSGGVLRCASKVLKRRSNPAKK